MLARWTVSHQEVQPPRRVSKEFLDQEAEYQCKDRGDL